MLKACKPRTQPATIYVCGKKTASTTAVLGRMKQNRPADQPYTVYDGRIVVDGCHCLDNRACVEIAGQKYYVTLSIIMRMPKRTALDVVYAKLDCCRRLTWYTKAQEDTDCGYEITYTKLAECDSSQIVHDQLDRVNGAGRQRTDKQVRIFDDRLDRLCSMTKTLLAWDGVYLYEITGVRDIDRPGRIPYGIAIGREPSAEVKALLEADDPSTPTPPPDPALGVYTSVYTRPPYI